VGHGGDAGHLNEIKGMALTCKTPWQELLNKSETYKSLQGTIIKGFKARLGSEARKVQWAIGLKEEVEKFRTVIIAKMVFDQPSHPASYTVSSIVYYQ